MVSHYDKSCPRGAKKVDTRIELISPERTEASESDVMTITLVNPSWLFVGVGRQEFCDNMSFCVGPPRGFAATTSTSLTWR